MTKRNISNFVLAAAVTACSASAAMFPPSAGDRAATIPFSFQAGDAVMSAGEYVVRVGEQGQVELCEDGVYCAVVKTSVAPAQGPSQDLVFAQSSNGLRLVGVAASGMMASETETSVGTRELCVHEDGGPFGVRWH